MRPPSTSSGPRVLQTRPVQDLFNHLSEKHKQLTSLRLSVEQRERIDGWVEAQFVYSTLRLDRLDVTDAEVLLVISNLTASHSAASEQPSAIQKLVEGFRLLDKIIASEGPAAALSSDLLLTLNGGKTGFRTGPGEATRPRSPIPPEHLPAIVESVCDWFKAESFSELNPIEQASIIYLRLIEIQPFDQANEPIAILGASLFTRRNDLPPLIVTPALAGSFRSALDESTRGNTQPMVEVIGTAVEFTLSRMIELAAK